jgi:hypothetical protein
MLQPNRTVRFHVGSLIVLLAMLIVLPSASRAAEADPALRHLNRGLQLLSNNRDQEALEEFRAAYDLSPSIKALAQMGLAEASLKLWLDAEKHLSEVLGATDDKWVVHNTRPIEEQLEQVKSHLGWLVVTGTAKAEVIVDGKVIGKLPLPRRLIRHAEGWAVVEARLDAQQPIRKNVEVVGRQFQQVDLQFQALPAPVAPRPAPIAAQQIVLAPQAPALATPEASEPWGYRALPWISMAAGAFAFADGMLLYRSSANTGLSVGTMCAGGLGLAIGAELLVIKAVKQPNPGMVKAFLIVSTALAAAGGIVGGSVLVYRKGYGSILGAEFGGMSAIAGASALMLDTFVLFEPTPGQPRIAVAPTPSGLVLFGRF